MESQKSLGGKEMLYIELAAYVLMYLAPALLATLIIRNGR